MAINCRDFSTNAKKIFDKIVTFFPDDSFGAPQTRLGWEVCDNSIWYDLRQSEHRRFLIESRKNFLGHLLGIRARTFRDKNNGSLEGLTEQRYTRTLQHNAELLLLFEDLDFQIETGDFV